MLTVTVNDFTSGLLALGINLGTGAPSVTRTADTAWLQSMIDVYEREFLHKLLGYEVSDAFIAWLQDDARDDNAGFTKLEAMLKDGAMGVNPAAAYVYFKVLDTANERASATGVHRTADEGSVNPRALQIRAWNIMAAEVRDMCRRMRDDEDFADAPIFTELGLTRSLNWYGI